MNYRELCEQTIEIVKGAAQFINKEFENFDNSSIKFKDKNDLVSYVDIETENFLKAELTKILPSSGFIAEESHIAGSKVPEVVWIIDPLDGTTNFIHKLPLFCVSVALMVEGKIRIGVVHEVKQDECFYAWEGSKAYMNGKEIHVSKTTELMSSLIATGFPFKDFHLLDFYIDFLKYLMKNSRGVRRLGSAAADLAYVACGRFDAFYEYNLSPWDVAGGAFIVQQAGGLVSDFDGRGNYLFGKEIIAASPLVFEELVVKLREWKGKYK
jgi:myo-inositol-1(or 4)-monophosphatase